MNALYFDFQTYKHVENTFPTIYFYLLAINTNFSLEHYAFEPKMFAFETFDMSVFTEVCPQLTTS